MKYHACDGIRKDGTPCNWPDCPHLEEGHEGRLDCDTEGSGNCKVCEPVNDNVGNTPYIVFGKNSVVDIVKERDLELVLCNCKGKLSIKAVEEQSYGSTKSVMLVCKKCGGKYMARQMKEAEKRNHEKR